MIGTFEIRCHAAKPQMPLPPMFAFKDSPSSLRLLEIPKKIGEWTITTVKVAVNYPDNTTNIYTASRNGNVWVVTFNGCSITGKVANGLEVLADGLDENGDAVNGYVLGVGDIYILDRDTDVEEAVSKHTMRYCDETPETPVGGDVVIENGALKVYDGTQWISVDIDLSEYATKSELETAASTLDDKIDSTKTELESSIAEVASDIPTATSELTNDSGFITSASVPTKTSDLTNDSGYITSTQVIPSQTNVGNASMSDKSLVSQTLVNEVTDEHSTRVIVDEYDNVFVQKYTTGWYVSKIEVAVGASTDYAETNEYYAYLTDVRLDTEAGRLYYATVAQDKQRNLSPYKWSDFTQNYSTGEFIAFSNWTATQAGGQSIHLHLTITNAETPVWVNIARLVPDSAKWSGLFDTQITPKGQFLTPTQVKPYDQIPGYARRAYGSLFMFGRSSPLTPDENHFVTIDFNVGKLCYVGQTQYPWQLSMYNGTTFDPPIQMNYGYWGTVAIKANGRIRNFPINSNCWLGIITVDSRNTRPCYIKGIENESGSVVADNNFYYYNESYPITFSANKLSIETIDGVEGGITCTRQGTGTHQTELKYFPFEDQLPTKVSDLTNDAGYLTTVSWNDVQDKPSIPTKTSDLTNDSDFTTNTALNTGLALKQDTLTSAQLSNIARVPYIDPANTIVTFDDDSVGVYNVVGELTQDIKQEWERLAGAYVKDIKIGTNVNALGNSVFYRAYNSILTSVTIPDSVTSIGSGAFSGCTSLTKVTIPNSVTNIANSTFFGCSNLTSVTIPNGVTSIEGFAFRSCTSLSSVAIPESTTNIGENAFRQSGITNITIPNSISSIGTNAFLDCTNLTSLTFKGKTLAEVQSMSNYPWGISDTSIIKTWNDASQEWVLEQIAALRAELQGGN